MKSADSKGISIFFRLLLAFVGVVIVISGLLTGVFYTFSVHFEKDRVEEQLLQQLGAIGQSFHYHFQEALVRDLRVLVANPLLDEFIMSSELEKQIVSKAVERLFLQALTYTNSYQSLSFVNVLGKEVVRVDRSGRVRKYHDLKDNPLFVSMKTGASGSIHIEGLSIEKDGRASFIVGIHKIDGDIGKFGGALFIQYNLGEFFSYLDGIKMFGENLVWVLTPSGEIIKRPSRPEASFDPSNYLPRGVQATAVEPRSLPVGMIAFQDLSLTADQPLMRMAVSVPSSLVLKDIRATIRFFVLVFVFSICGAVLIAVYVSRYLSRPIVKLASAAERLAKGDLSSQVDIKAGGEVKMLVESFNRMTEDLRRLMTKERELADAATEAAETERRRATELEQLKEQLIEKTNELERSNGELQQFAYVASHDLQEPLRMVASYMQLLERRYKDKLDADAGEFIAYAVAGVNRMRTLINDLLEYSRVGTRAKAFELVDCAAVVRQALTNLQLTIQETGTTVTYNGLPTVLADGLQLTQIFQNLISNAIKFRSKDAPRIEIAVERRGQEWCFAVHDNGIGLDQQYADRIFIIFQRLHTQQEYPGTGIGLAICKRVVERHGGRIWVESAVGQGATFCFTLPMVPEGTSAPNEGIEDESQGNGVSGE